MKPIAIFRHAPTEGPGHFASFLDRQSLPWTLIRIDAGDAVPGSPQAYSGLVFMGGPMSVNDGLPWIAPALSLIRAAVAADIPVLGHCLGGQLIAKALGGEVGRTPAKEIGWGTVRTLNTPVTRAWFGEPPEFEAFHWHGETFSIPAGATRILESAYCPNQAFVLGKHLGMQCHVEMTEEMVRSWCDVGAGEIAAADSPAVQSAELMLSLSPARLPPLHRVADQLYGHWIAGLRH
jgi:GMP synthase-like glutamine amidotransferase